MARSQPSSKRILLAEGAEGAFYPDTRYVIQGKGAAAKAFVFEGTITPEQLCESAGGACALVESFDRLDLVERADGKKYVKDGRWIVEGVFQRSDVVNANKRKYSRGLWERTLKDKEGVMRRLHERAMTGHCEHPADGRTKLDEVALVTTDLKLREDGVVWGRAELLNTPKGEVLQELTAKKVRWGVSSRASGSVGDDGSVSEDDFSLDCWDAVSRPSTPGAYPTVVGPNPQVAEAVALTESIQPSQGLSEADAIGLARKLLSIHQPIAATCTSAPDAHAALQSVLSRLSAITEAVAPSGPAISVGVVRAAGEALKARAAAALEEAAQAGEEVARIKMENSRIATSVAVLKNLLDEAKAELGRVRQRLVESEAETVKAKRALEAAVSAAQTATSRVHAKAPTALIEEAIAESPGLERYRGVLAALPETEVPGAVALLLRESLERQSTKPEPSSQQCLPSRLLAESETRGVVRTSTPPGGAVPSRNAEIAAKALASMNILKP